MSIILVLRLPKSSKI